MAASVGAPGVAPERSAAGARLALQPEKRRAAIPIGTAALISFHVAGMFVYRMPPNLATRCLLLLRLRGGSCGFSRRDREQLLLRRALVEQRDGLAQRRIVRQVAALRARVTEGEPCDTLFQQTVHVPCGAVVILAVHGHALRLESAQELLTPCGLDREVLVRALGKLQCEVVVRRVEVLLLRGQCLCQALLRGRQCVVLDDDVRCDSPTAVHGA